MKMLLISTSVFQLNPITGTVGYSGLENLVAMWAMRLRDLGCEVSVVCPEGSDLGQGIEIIPIPLGCGEDVAWGKYKDRLTSGEFSAIEDHSWTWFSVISQMEADKQLPVMHCYHSDPYNLGAPPPIEKPCLVAFSEAQANVMRGKWNHPVRRVHHGVDTSFYKPDPTVARGNRYLFLARYTPEKGFLELATTARKLGVPLDAYGDTTIVANQDYVRHCFDQSDGRLIRVMPGVPRQEAVKQYQTHKALLTWPNYMEIFGLTTVEAMCCGCPVISKDSGAARELIEHGKSGFVVQSIEELEDLIRTDAVGKLRTEDIIARGQKFNIEASAQGHLKLLGDLAAKVWW